MPDLESRIDALRDSLERQLDRRFSSADDQRRELFASMEKHTSENRHDIANVAQRVEGLYILIKTIERDMSKLNESVKANTDRIAVVKNVEHLIQSLKEEPVRDLAGIRVKIDNFTEEMKILRKQIEPLETYVETLQRRMNDFFGAFRAVVALLGVVSLVYGLIEKFYG